MTRGHSRIFSTVSGGALVVAGLFAATPALAQSQPAPNAAPASQTTPPSGSTTPTEQHEDTVSGGAAATGAATPEPADSGIVVTGYRASLANALSQKRRSNQEIDAITAEDIANFPEANLAEAIQRLPGVSIDRDNGEGRTITVRGLGPDFQMVRLNGADAQAVGGGNTSDAGANRSRGFDFNTFGGDLFGNVVVTKTTSAANDEGSLGAIVDLTTYRPLSIAKDRFAAGLEGEYRQNGKTLNPRFNALVSKHITNTFGIAASVSYQKQDQTIDSFQRSIGAFEYTYRNSQHNGKTPNVFGFAQPSTAGTGPTFGSDPAAYALITPTTIIPALPSINRQFLSYDRLGATLTAQWKPSSHTEVVADFVFSRYMQNSTTNSLTTIGLNRNGTNARAQQGTLRAPGTANGNADRVALYPTCVQSASEDCGGTLYGGVIPGMLNSMNPNNLNPFDYYNNPASPGFVPSANQTGFYPQLIGRPNTIIRQAHVNGANQADYLVLDNVDWRSDADAQFGKTNFKQGTINFRQDIGSRLHADGTVGWARSRFTAVGLLAEFNAIDQNNYTFDARGNQIMPVFSPGFDVANPNNWQLVKGLSTIRYFNVYVNNDYKVARLNFHFDINKALTFRFGGTWKRFGFATDQGRRDQNIEAINPTLAEAHLTADQLGHVVGFGQGLDVSQGTPTSFFAPDLNTFRQQFGIDCNCINKWGDFRAVVDGRQRNSIVEKDLSGYVQLDWDFDLFGHPLRGDAGTRIARTRELGNGNVGATDGVLGLPVTAHNEYTDWLPSTNIVYEPMRDFLIRFAASKTIARPQLANLTPGTTSFSSGLSSSGAAPTVTVGNTYLKPFRSTNFDVSFERYFGRNGLIAVAGFSKKLATFPQQIAGEAPLSSVFEPDVYNAIVNSMTSPTLKAYTLAGGTWGVRQFQDAPGGTIRGVEVNLQSNFTFLPAPFDNFGVTANYTHIWSSLHYLTGTVLATTQKGTTPTAQNSFATAPFLNTSPDAVNATLYYETSRFSARVSAAWRKEYVNKFPLASGTCSVGTTTNAGAACNSPVVADFGYRQSMLNIDAEFQYNLTNWMKFTLEGRNLTNQPTYNTMYADSPVTQTYASTGRVVTAGVRFVF
ncbi:MAG TPA: TonB-dependent receptor [Allosphingosinicella sp.]|nr:TonB-dependent receptor [Allosphingosinicella sp.]